MGPTRILSIDWDYFFPNGEPYDMGHSENHSETLAQVLWANRTSFKNILTGEDLLDAYVPTIPRGFWKKVLKSKVPVYVAESHFRMWDLIENEMFAQVTSLDAHHDCGYKKMDPDKLCVDCSNWAAIGKQLARIGRMDLVYPAWREKAPEGNLKGRTYNPTSIRYTLPDVAEYDKIFICRSGAWTPPWHDAAFEKFVADSGCERINLGAVELRGISIEEAKKFRSQVRDQVQTLLSACG
jgi:hypothetical protein